MAQKRTATAVKVEIDPVRKYAKEVTGEWYGVSIPAWLRAFDCRASGDDIAPTSPWGTTLWSSERAEVDLGLRTQTNWFSTTPLSCSTYIDARTCSDVECAKQVTDMVKEATKFRAEYEDAKAHEAPKGQGGGVYYQPVAIVMSNFGWSILADNRTGVVRSR